MAAPHIATVGEKRFRSMSRPKKNRALIIVNYDFNRNKTSEKLQRRPGAEKEAKKLFRALSKCNYAVTMHYDLTAQEIEHVYKEGVCLVFAFCRGCCVLFQGSGQRV